MINFQVIRKELFNSADLVILVVSLQAAGSKCFDVVRHQCGWQTPLASKSMQSQQKAFYCHVMYKFRMHCMS